MLKLRTSFFCVQFLVLSVQIDTVYRILMTDYFLGIHFISSAFKSRVNFRANTKR